MVFHRYGHLGKVRLIQMFSFLELQPKTKSTPLPITFVIFSAQQEQSEEHKVMFLAAVLIGKHLYVGT